MENPYCSCNLAAVQECFALKIEARATELVTTANLETAYVRRAQQQHSAAPRCTSGGQIKQRHPTHLLDAAPTI